jgi:hypothetical protein
MPIFEADRRPKWTDFNDMAAAYDSDVVADTITDASRPDAEWYVRVKGLLDVNAPR